MKRISALLLSALLAFVMFSGGCGSGQEPSAQPAHAEADQVLQQAEAVIIGKYWNLMEICGFEVIDLVFILDEHIQTGTYRGHIDHYDQYAGTLYRSGTHVYREKNPTVRTDNLGPFKFEDGSIYYLSDRTWQLFAVVVDLAVRDSHQGGQEYVLTLQDGFWGERKTFTAPVR